ncbi:MAG: molybdopterin oxidoreductase family protein [Myxococcota bacterium]|nr:molybdopterin oxidoreductase family protein [Myxococcota bacterium]
MPQLHHRACHLCEAICGIVIETEEDRILSIRGDKEDPLSQGHICPKAVALQDLHADPDRLRKPVKRVGEGWEEISWEEALALTAAGIKRVQDANGNNAVAVFQGNPTVHNHGLILYAQYFVRALHTKMRFSSTSVDQLPHQLVAMQVFGHQLMMPVPDVDRSRFLLIIGGNPAASMGSLMTAPGIRRRLAAIQERGGSVIVVDPRRTETADLADAHLFIRPGTDALLLAAMVTTLFETDAVVTDRLSPLLSGVEAIREGLASFTPEAVAPITGISAAQIRDLTRQLAAVDGGSVYGRMGVSTQPFGGLCQWLITVLNVLTGNLDRPGGAMFATPAVDVVKGVGGISRPGRYGRWRSRVRGLPEFDGELPAAVLAEEILTEGEGQIRALVTSASNPVLSVPNGTQLDTALAGLDFMVSVDFYINETTRHAHVILPPTSPLERDHYDLVFNLLAVRNTAKYSPALFQPAPDAKHDWQIMLELEKRLTRGVKSRAMQTARQWVKPAGIIDYALRTGPYGGGIKALSGLSLATLKANPSGVDLGPLKPVFPERLFTKDGRIHLAPELLLADLPRLSARLVEGVDDGLLLIGRRHLRSNNSWMHNAERLVRGKPRCTLLVHPQDAERIGLVSGELARVRSRVGELLAPVVISDEVMPGVVSLPHGWGHGRAGVRMSVASAHAGVSANDLTDELRVDPLCGTAAVNGVPVEVAPA